MALSQCISLFTENKAEKYMPDAAFLVNESGYHGSPDFPVAIYLDDVSHQYVNWHWHEEFEIGFVIEGTVIIGCGNRKYRLECGDIFFVNSNVLHSMHKDSSASQAIFKSIAFHSSLISESINSIFYSKYLLPILTNRYFRECIFRKDCNSYQDLLELLATIWNLVYTEAPDYEIQVRNGLSSLFCILNRCQKDINEMDSLPKTSYLLEKRVQLLLDYIHTHYQDKISIEELAQTASISPTEVLRCFKTIMGLPPIRYLNSYRLQRAAHLLTTTEKSIQVVAAECGFDDNSYFSKLFKQKYHVSPHYYRICSRQTESKLKAL